MKEDEMSDEIRMTLLHHSTNDLVEELLMWRSLAAEHLDRIAELREDNASLGDSNAWIKQNYEDLERDYGVMHEKMCARIDQLTAHSDIERQDDKSSNDTQKETFVYGKERER